MITSFHLLNCEIIAFHILSDSNIIRSMPEQTGEEQIVQNFSLIKPASTCFKNTVFISVILFIAFISVYFPEDGIGEDEAAGCGSKSSGLRAIYPSFHVSSLFVKGVH